MENYYNFNGETGDTQASDAAELNDAENGFFHLENSTDNDTGESSDSGDDNNSDKPSKVAQKVKGAVWGSKKRKRNTVITLTIALLTGGGLGGLTFLSGPMQFVGIAKTLEQAHFAVQQDESNYRTFKLFQYMRKASAGEKTGPDKTKLSFIGNRLADTVESKLNEAGITSEYGGKLNVHKTGYTIDPNNEKFKGMTDAQIKDYFKQNYNIDVTGDRASGLQIPESELSFSKSRFLVKGVLTEAGYSKIGSVIGAHVMGTRDGITWHPLKKLDASVKNAIDDWWKSRGQQIEDGVEPTNLQGESDPPKDKNGKTNPTTADSTSSAAGAATAAQSEAAAAGSEAAATGSSGPLSTLEHSATFKLTTKVTNVLALLCLAKQLDASVNQYKLANVILPLVRLGMESVTLGNQVMNGTDVNTAEMAKLAGLLYNVQDHTSWASAQSVQADMGDKTTGPAPDPTLQNITKGSPFSGIAHAQGLGTLCGRVGQDVMNIIGFFAAPVASIVMPIATHFLGPPVMNALIHWMAGRAVDPNASGAAYGYNIDYGTALAANDQAVTTGGTVVAPSASKQMISMVNADANRQFESHSFLYRTFSITDPQSLLGHIIIDINPNFFANVTNFADTIFNYGHFLAAMPMRLLNGTVFADINQPYDYRFPQYGYTLSEIQSQAVENPYQNGQEVAAMLNNKNLVDGIQSKANNCFKVQFVNGPDGWDTQVLDPNTPFNIYDNTYQGYGCSSPPSGLSNQQWLQVRMFIFDMQTIKSIDCYEGNNNSCIANGFNDAVALNSNMLNLGAVPASFS